MIPSDTTTTTTMTHLRVYKTPFTMALPKSDASAFSVVLSVNGLTCSACVQTVTRALESLDDVEDVRVSLQTYEAVVIGNGKTLDTAELIRAIQAAGYDGRSGARSHDQLAKSLEMKAEIARLRESFAGLQRLPRAAPREDTSRECSARTSGCPHPIWYQTYLAKSIDQEVKLA